MSSTPTFKVDSPGLWDALRKGEKRWDARYVDPDDRRFVDIYMERTVSFLYTDGEKMSFFLDGLRVEPWAPHWVFMLLGDRIS